MTTTALLDIGIPRKNVEGYPRPDLLPGAESDSGPRTVHLRHHQRALGRLAFIKLEVDLSVAGYRVCPLRTLMLIDGFAIHHEASFTPTKENHP